MRGLLVNSCLYDASVRDDSTVHLRDAGSLVSLKASHFFFVGIIANRRNISEDLMELTSNLASLSNPAPSLKALLLHQKGFGVVTVTRIIIDHVVRSTNCRPEITQVIVAVSGSYASL